MNFDFLKKYNWKEIQDEWYGSPDEEKPVEKIEGRACRIHPKKVFLENADKIVECPSVEAASRYLDCHDSTIRKNANKGWGIFGYKITRE